TRRERPKRVDATIRDDIKGSGSRAVTETSPARSGLPAFCFGHLSVRIYFGVGGLLASSLHLIGEIFDRVYPEGAVGSSPNRNVQTTFVPAGGATMVEFQFQVPGTYTLVDHSLPRALDKGAAGQIVVTGEQDTSIYSGPLT